MSSEDLNRRRRKIWFWGILALSILFILCLWSHSRSIPRDIEGRVREALTTGGFNPELLSAVDGRRVLLAGEIDEGINRDQLAAIAQSVRGVRSVTDNLEVIQLGNARFSLKSSGTQIILQGVMPDTVTVEKMVAAAARAYGDEHVTNQLSVQSRLRQPRWIDGLVGLVPALVDLEDALVVVEGGRLLIGGTLTADEKRSMLLQKAKTAAGGLELQDRIVVALPKQSAQVSIRMSEGQLTLSGKLPDPSDIDRVLAAVHNQFGAGQAINEMKSSDSVTDPAWLDGVLQLFGYLTHVAQGGIEADDSGVLILGVVADQDQRSFIDRRAKALFVDMPIDNRIQVKPPAPATEPLAALPEFPPLYYVHDSTDLVEASQRLLNEVVDLLKRYPNLRLEIGAHTDSAGDEIYNQDLSNRRAKDMAQILTAAGIEADRLIPKGYGENQPIAENSTAQGRAMNRRIELKVLE